MRDAWVLLLAAMAAFSPRLEGGRGSEHRRVPEGFMIEKVCGPEVVFPMFATFDDRGRLFVTESSGGDLYLELQKLVRKCRVRVLEDRDLDGRFETSSVFFDGLTPSMGLCWREGRLYVADPPDLVTLEDTDGDGRADRRRVLLTGFGHQDNGSLHGLAFGPDGLLYFTMGQPDGYRLKRRDGSVLEGRSGALLRSRPDGSRPEVVSRGFQNLIEVVWTRDGDVIGTDNWFQEPLDGMRDALVHLAEGGLYPYVPDEGTLQPVTGRPLPALALFPAVALSGIVRYQGTGFPESYRDNLFTAQHNSRKVVRHILRREGSTFRSREEDFVTTDDPDFHPSDVLEDADGSLLVVDTGSWYVQHCPTGRIRGSRAPGGIYRVRARDAKAVEDPWGKGIDWTRSATAALVERLADPRPVVRDRAVQELVDRRQAAPIEEVLAGGGVSVKQRAAWMLAAIPGDSSFEGLRKLASDPEPGVARAAARAIGVRGSSRSSTELSRLLSHADISVRFAAAEALARSGTKDSLPHLWSALTGEPDRFLEHALIHAVYRRSSADDLDRALSHDHARVQKAALLLIDQDPDREIPLEAIVPRLASSDFELRETALGILHRHPEWAAEGSGLVRAWLRRPVLGSEEELFLMRTILAFASDPSMQDAVAKGLTEAPPRQRLGHLLETLGEADLRRLPEVWRDPLGEILERGDTAARRAVIALVTVFQDASFNDTLDKLAEDPREPAAVRVDALRARIIRQPELSETAFEFLTAQLTSRSAPLRSLVASETIQRAHLTDIQVARAIRAVRGHALVAPGSLIVGLKESTGVEGSEALLEALEQAALAGWTPTSVDLERLRARLSPEVMGRARALEEHLRESQSEKRARMSAFEPLLRGGDVERGRSVFFGDTASCGVCHSVNGTGGRIGPDLTRVGAVRAGGDLLESILFPASTLAQGYETYVVVAEDSTVRTGILDRRTPDAVVLVDASGRKERIDKSGILELTRGAASLMPDGLERLLGREEFRDLLAFLQSLR